MGEGSSRHGKEMEQSRPRQGEGRKDEGNAVKEGRAEARAGLRAGQGNDLGSIQGHAEAAGPIQLLSKGWRAPRLLQHIVQGAPGTELCHDAGRVQAQPHEQHDVGVPDGAHYANLHHHGHLL